VTTAFTLDASRQHRDLRTDGCDGLYIRKLPPGRHQIGIHLLDALQLQFRLLVRVVDGVAVAIGRDRIGRSGRRLLRGLHVRGRKVHEVGAGAIVHLVDEILAQLQQRLVDPVRVVSGESSRHQ
jgi:hypothetical protein